MGKRTRIGTGGTVPPSTVGPRGCHAAGPCCACWLRPQVQVRSRLERRRCSCLSVLLGDSGRPSHPDMRLIRLLWQWTVAGMRTRPESAVLVATVRTWEAELSVGSRERLSLQGGDAGLGRVLRLLGRPGLGLGLCSSGQPSVGLLPLSRPPRALVTLCRAGGQSGEPACSVTSCPPVSSCGGLPHRWEGCWGAL